MGAWGHRAFDNDSACDWFGELGDDASAVRAMLERAEPGFDVDDASAVIAAAELVLAARAGAPDRLPKKEATWLSRHRAEVAAVPAAVAVKAVRAVFEDSELRGLWDEGGAESKWHACVRELVKGLETS